MMNEQITAIIKQIAPFNVFDFFSFAFLAAAFSFLPFLVYQLSYTRLIKTDTKVKMTLNIVLISVFGTFITLIVGNSLTLGMMIFGLFSVARYFMKMGNEHLVIFAYSAAIFGVTCGTGFIYLALMYSLFLCFLVYIINQFIYVSSFSLESYNSLVKDYRLSDDVAKVIARDINLYQFFVEVVGLNKRHIDLTVQVIKQDLCAFLNKKHLTIKGSKIQAKDFSYLIEKLEDKTILRKHVRVVINRLYEAHQSVQSIVSEIASNIIKDEAEIKKIVSHLKASKPNLWPQYENSLGKLMGFCITHIEKECNKVPDPYVLKAILQENYSFCD